ncbi:CoA ester lyase [Leucobacter sp. CSA1]|uniref:CoA ester lyase n=1 Tax=Leucobacter chromiisoli TaxID=2796471 RepID=A0A934Q9R7_9MICO|nr:CoA ester lyase [Leucobacter chromiisoli]MBK0419776.1 CoA ester lyase [Leucobacter chromiisoli]
MRSLLYVPGDRPDRLAKAWERGSDGLIVDLEDAVAPARKAEARATVGEWLAGQGASRSQRELRDRVWLRITAENPGADIAAISASIGAVMVPKAEPDTVARVAALLDGHEAAAGLEAGSISLVPLIETARGLLDAPRLAAMRRVRTLAIGRADLAGDLGFRGDLDGAEFRGLMLQLVVACAAAGIAAPVAPTSTDFRDLDALRESTARLLALGFRGRTAIHPAQVPVINEVFSPSEEEVVRARRLVEEFERSVREGSGVFVDEGRMVDAAVIRGAREVLNRAG